MLEITEISQQDLPHLAALYQQLSPNKASLANMRRVITAHRDDPSRTVWAAKRHGQLVAQHFYTSAGYQADGYTAFKKTLSDGDTG